MSARYGLALALVTAALDDNASHNDAMLRAALDGMPADEREDILCAALGIAVDMLVLGAGVGARGGRSGPLTDADASRLPAIEEAGRQEIAEWLRDAGIRNAEMP